jgi:hypothetical protein
VLTPTFMIPVLRSGKWAARQRGKERRRGGAGDWPRRGERESFPQHAAPLTCSQHVSPPPPLPTYPARGCDRRVAQQQQQHKQQQHKQQQQSTHSSADPGVPISPHSSTVAAPFIIITTPATVVGASRRIGTELLTRVTHPSNTVSNPLMITSVSPPSSVLAEPPRVHDTSRLNPHDSWITQVCGIPTHGEPGQLLVTG